MLPRTLLVSAIFGAASFIAAADSASNYLPLQVGNEWTYREAQTGSTMTMRVGIPASIGGHVYHRLTGYASAPLWVRFVGDTLLYRAEENDREQPLTIFSNLGGAWFNAPQRGCEHEGQVDRQTVEYQGPAGTFPAALRITYRTFGCADAGIQEELYQPSLGMVRRVVGSISGPRQFDLVSARVGRMQLSSDNGSSFRVSVRETGQTWMATLRLTVDEPFRVRKPAVHDFDVALKTENGRQIWRWSDGKMFPPAIVEKLLLGVESYDVEVPKELNGILLPPGRYVIEAWLTTGDERFQFSAATAVEISAPRSE